MALCWRTRCATREATAAPTFGSKAAAEGLWGGAVRRGGAGREGGGRKEGVRDMQRVSRSFEQSWLCTMAFGDLAGWEAGMLWSGYVVMHTT